MDFHSAISINNMLGGDSLGDAGNIGVGTLSIGASFDSKQLSDYKYTAQKPLSPGVRDGVSLQKLSLPPANPKSSKGGLNVKHPRGFQANNVPETAPVLEFSFFLPVK